MNIKTILGVAAVAVAGSAFFGKEKISDLTSLKDQLQFKILNLKNIKFSNGQVIFDVDIKIVNPTSIAIDIPGKSLLLKTLHFFSPSGQKLAVSNANVSDITLPANGSRTITDVPTVVSLVTVGNSFNEVLDIVSDPKNLKIVADIEIFGKSFTVNAQ